MGFKLRSSGLPFKQMGSSPAKQVTREQRLTDSSQSAPADATPRELHEKYKATKKTTKTTPKKPTPAKQIHPKGLSTSEIEAYRKKDEKPKGKKKLALKQSKKKAADGQDYSDKRYDYKSTDFLKTDYASGHGAGDLTTVKRLNKQNQEKGKDYKDHGDRKSGMKESMKKVAKPVDLAKAPTLGPKELPVNEGGPKRAVHHRS